MDKNRILFGLVMGLAVLTKMSALALPGVAALAPGLAWLQDRDTRALLVRGLVLLGLTAMVGGRGYARD